MGNDITERKGFFTKLKEGLTKTRSSITGRVDELIKYYREIDDEFFDELEETLIMGDVGVQTSEDIITDIRKRVKAEKIGDDILA